MKGMLDLAIQAMNSRDIVEYESTIDSLLQSMMSNQVEALLLKLTQGYYIFQTDDGSDVGGGEAGNSHPGLFRMSEWSRSYNFVFRSGDASDSREKAVSDDISDMINYALGAAIFQPDRKALCSRWKNRITDMSRTKESPAAVAM
jgi:hypothetical protein